MLPNDEIVNLLQGEISRSKPEMTLKKQTYRRLCPTYNILMAIAAHASASANAWWWFCKLYPTHAATVSNLWFGRFGKALRAALHVQWKR